MPIILDSSQITALRDQIPKRLNGNPVRLVYGFPIPLDYVVKRGSELCSSTEPRGTREPTFLEILEVRLYLEEKCAWNHTGFVDACIGTGYAIAWMLASIDKRPRGPVVAPDEEEVEMMKVILAKEGLTAEPGWFAVEDGS